MSNAIIGGQIIITIGSTPITLTSADINQSPQTFTLPAEKTININLGDLNAYLAKEFKIPAITFPGITQTSLVIQSFSISSAGLFNIAVNFDFGAGQGWQVFPGFLLNQVGFAVDYSTQPVITTITPASAAAGATVVIQGNDLAAASAVNFGSKTAAITAGSNTATSLTVTVPTGIAAGSSEVTVVNEDGTSAKFAFTVTA